MDDLPLFSWTPPEPPPKVVPFPLARRLGKVKDVVDKLATKTTQRHVESYREQVTEALQRQMTGHGITQEGQARELAMFWQAVASEMARRGIGGLSGNKGPGAA